MWHRSPISQKETIFRNTYFFLVPLLVTCGSVGNRWCRSNVFRFLQGALQKCCFFFLRILMIWGTYSYSTIYYFLLQYTSCATFYCFVLLSTLYYIQDYIQSGNIYLFQTSQIPKLYIEMKIWSIHNMCRHSMFQWFSITIHVASLPHLPERNHIQCDEIAFGKWLSVKSTSYQFHRKLNLYLVVHHPLRWHKVNEDPHRWFFPPGLSGMPRTSKLFYIYKGINPYI